MIQILGLRDVPNSTKKREVFFEKGMRLAHITDALDEDKIKDVLSTLPSEEHYNLYFTVAHCFEQSGRKMQEQWAIPFDVDNIGLEPSADEVTCHAKSLEIVDVCARAIGQEPSAMAVVFSGNGVQFFLLLTKPLVDEGVFARARSQYKKMTDAMALALKERGLEGNIDTSVWSRARLMRLACTENRKRDKPTRTARVLQRGVAVDFRIEEDIQGAKPDDREELHQVRAWPTPDTDGVLSGCEFIKHCAKNQAKIQEPSWYAMLTVVARLENGESLAHEYSKEHPDYNHYEVEEKYKQALDTGYPRTCKDIASRWDGCKGCAYYGKVTSPIMIRGKDFIASKDFGYRQRVVKVDPNGQSRIVAGKPVYEDLIKQYEKDHAYMVVADTRQVVLYNGKHWEYTTDTHTKQWLTNKVKPSPSSAEMSEFIDRLKSRNVTTIAEMNSAREGHMNFNNYVVKVLTGEMFPHDKEFGFFEVLPFNYDPRAQAPMFNQFLLDILSGSESMAKTVKEFLGYAISGDEYWIHKALIMYGDGENGKSVLFETLCDLVGKGNYSTLPMQQLKDITMRKLLENKLFNYSDETSPNAMLESETFKTASAGGEIVIKQLYVQEYTIKNKTKFLMACNELPNIKDVTHGLGRRLIIIPLKEKFVQGDPRRDPHIKKKLMTESSGIYNELMQAYKNLKIRGDFENYEELNQETANLLQDNDTVHRFVDMACYADAKAFTKNEELYQAYRMHAEMNGFRPLNAVHFSRRFNKLTKYERTKINGIRGYEGVALRKDY